ncbi:hypothetical protein ACFQX6_17590 [Streptosporangium lutulentum]
MEADKRAGRSSTDAIGRWQVSHDQALHRDWASEINGWLASLAQYSHGGFHQGGHDPYAHHGGGHRGGHHGSGMGSVVTAGAAGLVGGYVVADMAEEFFEGEEGEEE